MAHSPEEVRKQVKGYLIIGALLYVLTIVTVAVSYLHVNAVMAVILALIIATSKGSLVCLYFMHLISEKQMIYWVLALTVVLFGVLLFIPWGQWSDPIPGMVH